MPESGYYNSKKSDEICEDFCGEVRIFFHYFFNFGLSLVDLIILFCIDLIFTVFACPVVRPMGNLCFYSNLCFGGFRILFGEGLQCWIFAEGISSSHVKF